MRRSLAKFFAIGTVILSSILAIYVGFFVLIPDVRENAQEEALDAISRSAEMFMVSTRTYHEQHKAATTEEEKLDVKLRWIETIIAVDTAVINDFGPGKTRVRLVNDKDISGVTSHGGDATRAEIPFEFDSLQQFVDGRKDPIIVEEDGLLRMSVPLHASIHPGCASCHNKAENANVVLGTLNAYVPVAQPLAQAQSDAAIIGLILFMLTALGLTALYLLIDRSIIKKILILTSKMRSLTNGNIDVQIATDDVKGEMGEMANAIQIFKEKAILQAALERDKLENDVVIEHRANVETIIDDFRDRTKTVTSDVQYAIHEVIEDAGLVNNLCSSANEDYRQAVRSSETISTKMRSVAEASEALANSISEINSQIEHTNSVVEEATSSTELADKKINGLAQSAQQIGDFVDIIQGIAEQTNLLALNATIEAARAGVSGKGFAVVASEVKALASQTTSATEKIAKQISEVQEVTIESVEAIQLIASKIMQVTEASKFIASEIMAQNASTGNISAMVTDVAAEAENAANNLSAAADTMNNTKDCAEKLTKTSDHVANETRRLNDQISGFLDQVEAS